MSESMYSAVCPAPITSAGAVASGPEVVATLKARAVAMSDEALSWVASAGGG
jgi:hypothetical protein